MSQPEYVLHQHRVRSTARAEWGRRIALAVVVVFLCLAAVHNGNQTYLEAVDLWTEEKLARAERTTREPRARIWSKKCERQGKDSLATQADKEPWKVRCIPRRVLGANA